MGEIPGAIEVSGKTTREPELHPIFLVLEGELVRYFIAYFDLGHKMYIKLDISSLCSTDQSTKIKLIQLCRLLEMKASRVCSKSHFRAHLTGGGSN